MQVPVWYPIGTQVRKVTLGHTGPVKKIHAIYEVQTGGPSDRLTVEESFISLIEAKEHIPRSLESKNFIELSNESLHASMLSRSEDTKARMLTYVKPDVISTPFARNDVVIISHKEHPYFGFTGRIKAIIPIYTVLFHDNHPYQLRDDYLQECYECHLEPIDFPGETCCTII